MQGYTHLAEAVREQRRERKGVRERKGGVKKGDRKGVVRGGEGEDQLLMCVCAHQQKNMRLMLFSFITSCHHFHLAEKVVQI